jgi:hypothetical protein
MKKLVTPEVFNKAVDAALQMKLCKGSFDVYCENYFARVLPINLKKELNHNTKLLLLQDFDSHQWYAALFPLENITLHDPNAPAPQTVDLQRILQVIQSAKYYLASHPDNEIVSECADHVSSLQEVADYIISLNK